MDKLTLLRTLSDEVPEPSPEQLAPALQKLERSFHAGQPRRRPSRARLVFAAAIVAVAAATATVLFLVAGNVPVSGGSNFSEPASSAAVPGEVITGHGSMTKQYLDTSQLAEDSTLLVVGRVIDANPVQIADLPAIRYLFNVESTLAGDATDELAVYLFGEPGGQMNLDVPAFFNAGQRYVLFLRPTELPADTKGADGFYVVGLGAWGETSASRFTIWIDPAAGIDVAQLPLAFSLDEAAEVLSADRVGTAH